MARRGWLSTAAAGASVLLALAASTAFVFLPTTTTVTVTASPTTPPPPPVVTHSTLLEHEGSSVLVVLAIPVLVAALGLVVGGGPGSFLGRTSAAFLLCAFSVLGAASVGLFYVPAALSMVVAACTSPPRRAA